MNEHWEEFAKEGEDVVRRKLLTNIYGDNREEASAWLDHLDRQRFAEFSRSAAEREERMIWHSRSADIAAWIAAIAAITATIGPIISQIFKIFSSK